MKRRIIVITLLLAVGLMIFPHPGTAGMTPLSEEQLNDVVAQSGLSFNIDKIYWNMALNTLSYGDGDGLGSGTDVPAGYLSLCGVVFKGVAKFTTPLMVDMLPVRIGKGYGGLNSLNLMMTGMELQVDRFSIDAIRLGSLPGVGNSLGSIFVSNLFASVTGNVQISNMR